MPELIERHALLKKVYEHPHERERMTDGEWCRKCIYEAPKVEAEPVRHGHWIECDYQHLEHGEVETEPRAGWCCSVCHVGYSKKKMTYKQYCPHCGAKMDGGAENG